MKNLCMYLVFWFSFAQKKNVPKKIAFRSIQLKFSNVEKENSICNFYAPFTSLCVMRLLESTQTMADIYKDYQNVWI